MPTRLQIREKVRKITATPGVNQMSDAEIDQRINDFYLYRLPDELSTQRLKSTYIFTAFPNQDVYDVPEGQLVIGPPVYAGGLQIAYHQQPAYFYGIWQPIKTQQTIGYGDGSNINFVAFLNTRPVLKGSVNVSAGMENFEDDSLGNLVSNLGGVGSIDYLTGAISVSFGVAPVAAAQVYAQWQPYTASRPQDMLFYDQKIVLRPVPNQCYEMKLLNVIRPIMLETDMQEPLYLDWWETLALGTSVTIFEDRGDLDQYAKYEDLYNKRRKIANTRNLKQLTKQTSLPQYTTFSSYGWPYNSFPGGV